MLAGDEVERDDCMTRLKNAGIPTLAYYPVPLHEMGVFGETYGASDEFPNATSYARRTFSIPFSAYLTEEEQDHVIEVLR